ncbi:MAG: calcium-binding protein, partial [Candidatus Saccharibacteria bacterium]|nr:calcium-binding protein [Pseudorhodobacter sp.]
DVLNGGAGRDRFVFAAHLSGDFAVIGDFKSGETLELDGDIFTGLGPGKLALAAFEVNTTGLATEAGIRIVYNSQTGALLYDGDGSGSEAAVQFATLSPAMLLSNGNILVF